MSARESGKARRRGAIFAAARDLYRGGEAQVSAEQIARRAGVATATVYNLVGRREDLLGAMMTELFRDLAGALAPFEAGDPMLFGEAVVTESARLFARDPVVWRKVVHEFSGASALHIAERITPRPLDLQIRAMRGAAALGALVPGADPDSAAAQIYASYNGALFMWAGGFLSDSAVEDQARYGYWTVLAALGAEATRAAALNRLESIRLG